ncbi:unnamed protein product, partial [Brenthis ino]
MQITVFSYIIFYHTVSSLRLDKVIILSRHNARTPFLSKNLEKITPYEWPKWEEQPGFLTKKGFLLEEYMGKYFYTWLNKEGVLPKGCPNENDFYVYSSYTQRTMYSASAFINKGFPNCNITIYHADESKPEPILSNFIHNSSIAFRNIAISEMKNVLDHLNLNFSYHSMEDILNYRNSEFCKVYNKCDMSQDVNELKIVVKKKPEFSGPLKICNEAVDAFLMAYYNGFDLTNVAWGKLNTIEQWNSILELNKEYHNVKYNTSYVAQDLSRPLIDYIKKIFLVEHKKVTLIMGHDTNINTLLNAMYFKPFSLFDSFVSTPIGGKIVFQKWFDKTKDTHLLKINYIYQSNEQLRDGLVLSLNEPPKIALLELKNCTTDNEGFCLWDDFVSFLNDL